MSSRAPCKHELARMQEPGALTSALRARPGEPLLMGATPPCLACAAERGERLAQEIFGSPARPGQKGSTMPQNPTVGRIVHYTLTAQDAEQINRRRTTGRAIADRIPEGKWPLGAQAHIGNPASEGDVLPLVICRVWPDEYGPGIPGVNGQVLLDGNDSLWVTSVPECTAPVGAAPGHWNWPPRV